MLSEALFFDFESFDSVTKWMNRILFLCLFGRWIGFHSVFTGRTFERIKNETVAERGAGLKVKVRIQCNWDALWFWPNLPGKLLITPEVWRPMCARQVDIHSRTLIMRHRGKWVLLLSFLFMHRNKERVCVRTCARMCVCVHAWRNPLLVGRSNWFSFKVEKPVLAICAAQSSACVSGFAPLEHRTCSILVCMRTGGTAVVVT